MSSFENEPPQSDTDAISAGIIRSQDELFRKTDALVREVDAEYAFLALVNFQLCSLNKGYNEREHGHLPALVELAAFHLYPRFEQGGTRDSGRIEATIDALTEENHFRGLATAFRVDRSDIELAALQVHLRLCAESVRGSCYPSQARHRIEKIQGPFESWFQTKLGIGPLRALAILDAYQKAVNENLLTHKRRFEDIQARMVALAPSLSTRHSDIAAAEEAERQLSVLGQDVAKFLEDFPVVIPPSLQQITQIVTDLVREEWDALRGLIGLTASSRLAIAEPHEIRERPLYYLSGDRFVFVDISSVYDALFEALDRLTRRDTPFRDRHYVPQLVRWTEGEVCGFLLRLFPPSAVFRQLTYPDPDRPGGETELDAAVVWGPFLVLVEVKSKQFRSRSRIGDPSRLRDDLKASIEDALVQARRATRFIEATPAATFIEKGTGRRLDVRTGTVRRIFQVSVTLHHFVSLTTQLAQLKTIGLFRDSVYPWSVSLADFDIITRFAGSPDVFLHYIQRRLDLQRSEKNVQGDELDLFGMYLDNRLDPSKFWERKTPDGKPFTMLHISGGSERFDEWFAAEREGRQEHPDIRLNLPPEFLGIINGLRLRNDDGARWISFALLGLSELAVSKLERALVLLRGRARTDGRLCRVTFTEGDLVVSLVVARGMPPHELEKQTAFRAELERYRFKTSASIAIGIDAARIGVPFSCVIWLENPWVEDPELDRFVKEDRQLVLPGQRLPGRNKPCICGSGNKFKKCCLGKVKILPD